MPASPSPLSRIRSSWSTPAGIFTDSVLCFLIRPAPWQVGHGSGTTLPVPWHCGQVCWIEKKPCDTRTSPRPWQVGQVCGFVPGFAPLPWHVPHSSIVGMRIFTSVPRAASSSDNSRL